MSVLARVRAFSFWPEATIRVTTKVTIRATISEDMKAVSEIHATWQPVSQVVVQGHAVNVLIVGRLLEKAPK